MTTTTGRYGAMEMRHSRSEDLLGVISGSRSPSPNVPLPSTASEDDLIAASALHEATDSVVKPACPLLSSRVAGPPGFLADRIDPEDSIRDIVTENDLYRFVSIFISFSLIDVVTPFVRVSNRFSARNHSRCLRRANLQIRSIDHKSLFD